MEQRLQRSIGAPSDRHAPTGAPNKRTPCHSYTAGITRTVGERTYGTQAVGSVGIRAASSARKRTYLSPQLAIVGSHVPRPEVCYPEYPQYPSLPRFTSWRHCAHESKGMVQYSEVDGTAGNRCRRCARCRIRSECGVAHCTPRNHIPVSHKPDGLHKWQQNVLQRGLPIRGGMYLLQLGSAHFSRLIAVFPNQRHELDANRSNWHAPHAHGGAARRCSRFRFRLDAPPYDDVSPGSDSNGGLQVPELQCLRVR